MTTQQQATWAAPTVSPGERILTLDVLRGWAVLGILAVNALFFAWPWQLALAPGDGPFPLTGADMTAQWAVDVFFGHKARTLFAMLFGVSVFLIGGQVGSPAGEVLKRRLWWLVAFGLLHGLAFWYGDILLLYAWCGMFMMSMRSLGPRWLIGIGGGITLGFAVVQAVGVLGVAQLPPDIGDKFNVGRLLASGESIADAIRVYRSGLGGALGQNVQAWLFFQGSSLTGMAFAIVPLMMLGLGLFKSGFMVGRSPTWLYAVVAFTGAVFLALLGWAHWIDMAAGPDADPTRGAAAALQAFAPLATLGYAALLVLMTTRGLKAITGVLAPVGRMAFTNYLSQTLIMTSLFYMPWGPLWFGEVTPAGLWRVVGAIWLLQVVWSALWLHWFRYGPFEWVWRSLTHRRRVAIRR